MRVYVMHDGAGVQPGIYIHSPRAYFQDPQGEDYSFEIDDEIDEYVLARIIRDSLYVIGYDRPEKGRRTTIIIPTSHIVSIQIPEASE